MSNDFGLALEWKCATCGWRCVVIAPGFAGDGKFHYRQPNNECCGPISAQRVSSGYAEGWAAAVRAHRADIGVADSATQTSEGVL